MSSSLRNDIVLIGASRHFVVHLIISHQIVSPEVTMSKGTEISLRLVRLRE